MFPIFKSCLAAAERGKMKSFTEYVSKYGVAEFVLEGPACGNPFLEQWVKGTFAGNGETKDTEGFYDGNGIYRIRFMPSFEGDYTAKIATSWGTEETVSFQTGPAEEGNHGPVRVAKQFHFAYEDGTPYYPVGTTCYVWELQKEEIQEQTYKSLQEATFNKIRFCVFPKHYVYNLREPKCYPYEIRDNASWKPEDFSEEYLLETTQNSYSGMGITMIENADQVWDYSRFNPEYFAHIEDCVRRLGEIGVEADLILFHPYDRWGYSHLGVEWENHYLKYIVNRLGAFHNVWWAFANEYDLFHWKNMTDWESNAATVVAQDPYRHLRSIHNCMTMYDHTRAWITHCSIQRIDLYRTAEETDKWRVQYGKPCVLDEIAYEGDIPFGWGNISGEEMTRRFWEGYTRGGYGQHGETYEIPEGILWWSHGGPLHGTSPARIAFLHRIMEENGGYMEPVESAFDENICTNHASGALVKKDCDLYYYSANRPNKRFFDYPGVTVDVDVIDTWDMTVTNLGHMTGSFTVPLPAKPYMAVRITRV